MNNGALVLKSKNRLNEGVYGINYTNYKNRVLADGGEIVEEAATISAINFAGSNGISEATDKGIASVRWGVKRSAGKIVKLYSLFNANSDINVSLGTESAAREHSDFGFNSLYLAGSSANKIVPKNMTFDESITVLNVFKVPVLSDVALYGTKSVNMTQFQIGKLDSNGAMTESVLEFVYLRTSTQFPSDWKSLVFSIAKPVYKLPSVTPTTPQLPVKGFSSYSTYMDNTNIGVFDAGVEVITDEHDAVKTFGDTYEINLWGRKETFLENNQLNYAVVGDFVEVWVVADTSKVVAQKLSERSNTVYGSY